MARLVSSLILIMLAALAGCGQGETPPTPQPTPQPTSVAGFRLVLQAEAYAPGEKLSSENLVEAREVLRTRADVLGAESSEVRLEGEDRLVMEIRGAELSDASISTLVRTGFLEIVDGGDDPPAEGELITTTLGPPMGAELATAHPPLLVRGKVYETLITSSQIDRDKIEVTTDPMGQLQVLFALNDDGAHKLAEFTAANIGKYMPLLLDKEVVFVPIIASALPNGEAVIVGRTRDQTRDLEAVLRSGALPARLTVLEMGPLE
jgi:preprotein translocase subunit SecD